MPSWLSNRFIYGVSVLAITGLMSFAFFLQYVLELEPCPLCMAQRIVFVSLAVVFLVAFLHGPAKTGSIVYGLLGAMLSIGGLALAGRQLWLQSLPADQAPACGPSLAYMLEAFPLREVVSIMLRGSGDCAEVQWVFLGLSIPGWTAVAFSGFCAVCVFTMLRNPVASS
jgi:protein dithiol:quinone oxidoreductase